MHRRVIVLVIRGIKGCVDEISISPHTMSFNHLFHTGPGRDKKLQEIAIDMRMMSEIQTETSHNGVLFAALRMIGSQMFSGGINFEMEELGQKREAKEWFKDIVARYWMPFIREALMQVYMYGFFVVIFARPDSSVKDKVPVVPQLGSYHLTMYFENGLRKYHVYDVHPSGIPFTSGRKLIPGAMVFEVWGPNQEGHLTSPIASVFGHIKRLREGWENMQDADYWRTHPPSIRERHFADRASAQDPLPEALCGEDVMALDEERYRVRQTRHEYELASLAGNLAARQNSISYKEVFDERTASFVSVERPNPWESTKMILPPTQRNSQFQIPEFHPDYIRLVELQQSTIALALGIPSQLLFNDTKQHAADVELTSKIFNSTVLDLQAQFKIFITRIYHEIYQDVIDDHVESNVQKLRTHRRRALNEREIQLIYEQIRTNVSFRFTPMVKLEDLIKLKEQQIMDHDTAGRYALSMFGFPETDLLEQSRIRQTEGVGKQGGAAANAKGSPVKPVERNLQSSSSSGGGGDSDNKKRRRASGDTDDEDDGKGKKKKSKKNSDGGDANSEPHKILVRAHERTLRSEK